MDSSNAVIEVSEGELIRERTDVAVRRHTMPAMPAAKRATALVVGSTKQGVTKTKTMGGEVRFLAQVRLKGHKPMSKTFTTFKEASDWKQAEEAKLKKQGFARVAGPGDMVLGGKDGLFAQYVAEAARNRGGVELPLGQRQEFDNLAAHPALATLTVADISFATLREYFVQRRAAGISTGTLHNSMARISCAVNAMALWHGWENFHPMHGMRKRLIKAGLVSKGKVRDRRPTKDELKRLIEHFREREQKPLHFREHPIPMADIISLQALNGFRIGETLERLTWEQLDVKHSRITLLRKDSGGELQSDGYHRTEKHTPVLPEAMKIILRQQPDPAKRTGLIFPYAMSTIAERFRFACAKLNIKNLRIHDMRHEASTNLAKNKNLSWAEVKEITGHDTDACLKIYLDFREEDHLDISRKCADIALPA